MVYQFESAHQSPNKMNSSKSPSLPHLLNGTPNYHQDTNTNKSGANKNSCETNKNIPEPENLQSQTRNKKQTFVGNLNIDLNIKDLKELFGFETTKISERKLQHQYAYKPENWKKQRYCIPIVSRPCS